MGLVRQILLAVETHDQGYAPQNLRIDGYATEQVGYHAYLLMQAGLVEGIGSTNMESTGPTAIILNLTW